MIFLNQYTSSHHTYNQLSQFLDRITSPQQERAEPTSKALLARTLEERIALCASDALTEIETALFDNPTTIHGITHRVSVYCPTFHYHTLR